MPGQGLFATNFGDGWISAADRSMLLGSRSMPSTRVRISTSSMAICGGTSRLCTVASSS